MKMEEAGPSNINIEHNETREETTREVKHKKELLPAFLQHWGLVKHHINSYNYFIDVDIKNIVKANKEVFCDADPLFYIKYLDIHIGLPDIEDSFDVTRTITPHECRLRDLNYTVPIMVDIEYMRGNQPVVKNNILIGRMPMMLRSSNCVLTGKTPFELSKMNECPHDPGGYFIIKGQEKVIMTQEQMVRNRILLEKDGKYIVAYCNSYTQERKTRTNIVGKTSKYFMRHNIFTEDILIPIVFKAMGIENDQWIVTMIGVDQECQDKLEFSIFACQDLNIFSQNQALRYLNSKLRQPKAFNADDMKDLLAMNILPHVPLLNFSFQLRAMHLAFMTRRIIKAQSDKTLLDDKDFVGNKRLEVAGSLMSLLFEDLFKSFNRELRLIANKLIPKQKAAQFDVVKHMRHNLITNRLAMAISTGNWTIKRFKMDRAGATQVLSRLSYISALGMMTRVNPQFENTSQVSGPRQVHTSQWGMFCPCDTPEGEACGLVKNLALMAHVTMEESEDQLKWILSNMGVRNPVFVDAQHLYDENTYLIFLNGVMRGVTIEHERIVRTLKTLRRRGLISNFISIYLQEQQNSVHISTDSGRLCRPYFIVENGRLLVEDEHMTLFKQNIMKFEDFLIEGLIEFLDVNEENDTIIATETTDIKATTTHMEIETYTILGVCANLIPYPHHNQSPRNTYQCAMGKQAVGTIGYNQRNRMDTVMYNLVYPQAPLVKTETSDLINFEKLPAGENAIIAIMSFECTIEDALVINRASLDRGYGRSLVYRTSKCTLKKYSNQTSDRIMGATIDSTTEKPIWKHDALDTDGIVTPGEMVENGQVLINKSVPSKIWNDPVNAAETNIEYNNAEVSYKGLEPAYVDKVMISSTAEEPLLAKVLLRQTRIPEIGDKFSSRHGQKGVIGSIVDPEDLPFNEEGMIPDIIMNPHGFPSRMTVGKLIEIMAGKVAALNGEFRDGTAFTQTNYEELESQLKKHGYTYTGKDIFYSGKIGEPIHAYIYTGTVYYQRLKHMVQDKIHARARGPKMVLTRQPTEGRSKQGGLRLGEMERDCLVAYGASSLLVERLLLSSDVIKCDICNHCGLIGYNGWCHGCRSSSRISSVDMPYSFKLLLTELRAMNIAPRLYLKDQRQSRFLKNKK